MWDFEIEFKNLLKKYSKQWLVTKYLRRIIKITNSKISSFLSKIKFSIILFNLNNFFLFSLATVQQLSYQNPESFDILIIFIVLDFGNSLTIH